MSSQNKEYFNYIVSFSDLTLKTGITANPFYRLQDFVQEATRHSVKVDAFEITSPSRSKEIALIIESSVCREFSHLSIDGHREWFKEDYSWIENDMERKKYIENYHSHNFEYMNLILNNVWDKHNNGKLIRLVQRCRKLQDPYAEVKNLASELGRKGGRIKAKLATVIANDIVRSVNYDNSLITQRKTA